MKFKIKICSACNGHGVLDPEACSAAIEREEKFADIDCSVVIEQNRCKDCLYSGMLFTRAPTTLYDYFHFIHAYATTPFLEKNSEYGFFRGKEAQLVIPSNYLDDLIQNLWPMLTDKGSDDDKWEHILDVFFGEDRGCCFECDRLDYDDIDYDQWYTDELFKKQYNPNKSKLFPEKVIPKEVGL